MTDGRRPGHHKGGARVKHTRESVEAERHRLHALPPSPDRTKALRRVQRQMVALQYRSPWKDGTL